MEDRLVIMSGVLPGSSTHRNHSRDTSTSQVRSELIVAPPRVAVVERLICGWLAGCGPRAK
jgi:hypothetical protein